MAGKQELAHSQIKVAKDTVQPDRELDYWPEFDIEVFFLINDYSAHTNCFVRADKPETAMKIYLEYRGMNNYANLFEKFYHDCKCYLTEVRPRMIQQMLSDEQLRQLQRDSVFCRDVSP